MPRMLGSSVEDAVEQEGAGSEPGGIGARLHLVRFLRRDVGLQRCRGRGLPPPAVLQVAGRSGGGHYGQAGSLAVLASSARRWSMLAITSSGVMLPVNMATMSLPMSIHCGFR